MKGPLYRSLAAALKDRIALGDYPPGAALPTEHELCALYEVSRHTARDALRLLQEAGLIERRRGAGTIVTRSPGVGRFVQSIAGVCGLLQYARNARLTVLSQGREPSDDPAFAALGLDPRSAWVRIAGVRRIEGEAQPVALTTIHIRADLCPDAATLAGLSGAVNEWIAAAHGVRTRRVEQDITAVALDGANAHALGSDVGAPALRTVRRYIGDDDSAFQASVSLHPGDRFSYAMTLERAD
ncbi:MAG: GntR family transcriptional regulator [Alphaproteobacteria bacterium]|jgi:GntR family transcriptional regulator|nr:GntR family transcriptional regulator [Alphaproteobacteria bacterium]